MLTRSASIAFVFISVVTVSYHRSVVAFKNATTSPPTAKPTAILTPQFFLVTGHAHEILDFKSNQQQHGRGSNSLKGRILTTTGGQVVQPEATKDKKYKSALACRWQSLVLRSLFSLTAVAAMPTITTAASDWVEPFLFVPDFKSTLARSLTLIAYLPLQSLLRWIFQQINNGDNNIIKSWVETSVPARVGQSDVREYIWDTVTPRICKHIQRFIVVEAWNRAFAAFFGAVEQTLAAYGRAAINSLGDLLLQRRYATITGAAASSTSIDSSLPHGGPKLSGLTSSSVTTVSLWVSSPTFLFLQSMVTSAIYKGGRKLVQKTLQRHLHRAIDILAKTAGCHGVAVLAPISILFPCTKATSSTQQQQEQSSMTRNDEDDNFLFFAETGFVSEQDTCANSIFAVYEDDEDSDHPDH